MHGENCPICGRSRRLPHLGERLWSVRGPARPGRAARRTATPARLGLSRLDRLMNWVTGGLLLASVAALIFYQAH
jgi:hypothetical protein